ncbi:elongation factor P maturation arginine rhamnosyltransferase EarP [Sulfuricystis thermophila]|uniref:elongation factor P maturation arginine rhamnosyltransferase EarP n=1 Tax=Sulfuricystis thermophila TaxID=2496847 RepID=UPI0024E01DD4|nr:elongation factor P maturation arginine rhamnosyltransferase EarP [Sulfuricystis thermophila]
MAMPIRCDIFCAVIDNLGDAGVCWRLAHQLAVEFGWRVRLWIDDPAPIGWMAPDRQGVEVCGWSGDFAGVEAADVVIESFACMLPARYIEAMRARARPPVWLNLEYLSAEDWVAGCHGLPSPQAGLQKFFFFPGFVPGTGGLLRERDRAVPPAPTLTGALEVSLFCYENPRLPALLAAWRDGGQPIHCHVCDGLPRQQVERWLGATFPANAIVERGSLTLAALPFLPQTGYDALLDRCHLNFVRGEDSFVRAQWAARPFVWQAYPQAGHAHLAKLAAFLDLYTDDAAVRDFFLAWNGVGTLDWPAFMERLPALAARAPAWARQIAAHGDLATNLVKFCLARL